MLFMINIGNFRQEIDFLFAKKLFLKFMTKLADKVVKPAKRNKNNFKLNLLT